MKTMNPINKQAQKIFNSLIDGLTQPGDHKKIDNTNGAFMPVCVECIAPKQYSIAHYYEQNGDLMADPEMVFWIGLDMRAYPISYRQDGLGIYREAVEFLNGIPHTWYPREQRNEAVFAGTWMRNIKHQQKLNLKIHQQKQKLRPDQTDISRLNARSFQFWRNGIMRTGQMSYETACELVKTGKAFIISSQAIGALDEQGNYAD